MSLAQPFLFEVANHQVGLASGEDGKTLRLFRMCAPMNAGDSPESPTYAVSVRSPVRRSTGQYSSLKNPPAL
jgi:hypothetical protein